MKNNIKELYDELKEKKQFLETVANEYGLAIGSVRANWMAQGGIPENKKARVHELLVNALKQQIKRDTKLIN